MRDYATVAPQFWLGKTGRELRKQGAEAQVVSFYLMTSPHANMLGLYYLPVLYIAHETGLGFEGALKGLKGSIEAGFCSYDEDTEMVWVHEMAGYQVGRNLKPGDKKCAGVRNGYSALPENPFLSAFYDMYKNDFYLDLKRENERDLEGASEGLRSQEQEQEQEQDTDHGASPDVDDPQQSAVKNSILKSGLNPESHENSEPGLNPGGMADAERPESKMDYGAVLDAYHELLPEMPQIKILTDSRKKHIRTFWKKYQFDDQRWRAYLGYIATHCRWMLEDRPNGNGGFWKRKNLDYLITERCYVAVKEERANDK